MSDQPDTVLPRFCGSCGRELTPGLIDCASCAQPPLAAAPTPAATVPPSFESLTRALALYFLLLAVCSVSWMVYLFDPDRSPIQTINTDIGVSAAMTAIVLAWSAAHWRTILPALRRTGPPRYYLLAPCIAVGTVLLAVALGTAAEQIVGVESEFYLLPYLESGTPIALALLLIAIQPAVIEELAFRGYIGQQLQTVLGTREALLVTAFLFAFLHLSPLAFVHLAIIGLALGVLRARSGSLYPCILLHFCHNAFVLLAEYLYWNAL